MKCPHCNGRGTIPRPLEPELRGIPKPAMAIIEGVAEELGITPVDVLKSQGNAAVFPQAKFLVVRRLRTLRYVNGRHAYSYEQIAQWFGNHHTSIMHLCKLPWDGK